MENYEYEAILKTTPCDWGENTKSTCNEVKNTSLLKESTKDISPKYKIVLEEVAAVKATDNRQEDWPSVYIKRINAGNVYLRIGHLVLDFNEIIKEPLYKVEQILKDNDFEYSTDSMSKAIDKVRVLFNWYKSQINYNLND